MNLNYSVPLTPDYSFLFRVEDQFDSFKTHDWFSRNVDRPFLFGLVYVAMVHLGQWLMRKRRAVEMNRVLFLWNSALAILSALGTVRILPEFVHALYHFGFRHSICNNCFYTENKVTAFWTYVFVMSKLAELFDTMFIVLKKRKVMFLHQFHHCSVLVFTWFMLIDLVAVGRWYMGMNFLIHTIMYGYYAARALNLKIPKKFAMCITVSQITQMAVGLFVSAIAFGYHLKGEKCDITTRTIILAIALYLLYGILFLNFFLKSYLNSKTKLK